MREPATRDAGATVGEPATNLPTARGPRWQATATEVASGEQPFAAERQTVGARPRAERHFSVRRFGYPRAGVAFRRRLTILAGLSIVLALAVVGSLAFGGPIHIAPLAVAALLLHWLPFVHVPHLWNATDATIIMDVRLTGTLAAVVAGAGLAVSGATFQGIFRNPLADSSVIGVSSGAALGAVVALLFPLGVAYVGFSVVSLAAFAGGLVAVLAVFGLARVGGRLPITTLLLAGFAVSAIFNAATMLLMSVAWSDQLQSMFFWLLGGLDMQSPDEIAVAAVIVAVGTLPLLALARDLNALALGDEAAMHVGINPALRRLILVVCGALVAAATVALCGIIGFVGLVIPHAARLLFGPDNRLLLPASMLLGAAFLVAVNAAALALSPVTLHIGVVTALLGAPLFLFLLKRRRDYVF